MVCVCSLQGMLQSIRDTASRQPVLLQMGCAGQAGWGWLVSQAGDLR